MSTLARLRNEAERLKSGRRVFVSSEPVSAYKVANNRKQLLDGDHPLVLALPEDSSLGSSNSISMLEASVGPDLHWTLSSINHVLRTVSKYGEPTYLFTNIMDTDPQAFVAVTLHKRSPPDELQHLEGVISRVCNFHVAESKPMQVPGPDQVVSALGKGLMKLVLGGGGSKHKNRNDSPPPNRTDPTPQQQQQYRQQYPGSQAAIAGKSAEQERVDYLASLDQRGTAHVATVGRDRPGSYEGGRTGSRYPDDMDRLGEEVPTAPVMPASRTAMGVSSKHEADARLAALKAELGAEGGPPAAPGVYATPGDTRPARTSAYPSIPTDDASPSQLTGTSSDWQRHTPGTLSNPFTGGSSGPRAAAGTQYGSQAPDLSSADSRPPQAPGTISYDEYLSRDEQWGASRGGQHHGKTAAAAPSGSYETERYRQGGGVDYADAGWGDSGRRNTTSHDAHDDVARREQRRWKYDEEARQAREEWERTQREAEARRTTAPATKPRVRYHEVRDDGGWGGDDRQPAYAYAGDVQGGSSRDQQQQGTQGRKQAPDWLEVLGKVFAGGPAYAGAAPDL